MNIESDSNLVLNEGVLNCKNCGFEYLHREKTEAFERTEDAAFGLHVKIENDSATTDTCLELNPSPRRDGLTIEFSCEGCKERSVLSIYQHKGYTLLSYGVKSWART